MDDLGAKASQSADGANGVAKRKRSVSQETPSAAPAPPPKAAKTHNSHLQINYLVRQYNDVLPLVSAAEDNMPSIAQTLNDYSAVIDRHESLAGNLGARPLGPILIKRFERLFDGAPKVLKSHGKEGTTVTWLDVVEFARQKPEQFNLEKMRDGVRVCQFYTKQSRVEISEEDFVLISSGMPQKLIPPQPIPEDEEKELGTLEIMEKSVAAVISLADQVSARARQTKHRLTARKNAIASRREAEAEASGTSARPSSADRDTGADSPTGFTAVNNTLRPRDSNGAGSSSLSNGKVFTSTSASPTTRTELMQCFTQQRERQAEGSEFATPNPPRANQPKGKGKHATDIDYASILLNSASPVPIPGTPSNLVSYPRPSGGGGASERYDDSGPYKQEMLSRMDSMNKLDRVMPPCDRCRRLHMDCLKNLTACLGCTKKHAKCAWKEVTAEELKANPHPGKATRGDDAEEDDDPVDVGEVEAQGVRDEELLGEDDSEEEPDHSRQLNATDLLAGDRKETAASDDGSGPDTTKVADTGSAMEIDSTQHEPTTTTVTGETGESTTSTTTLTGTDNVASVASDILKKRLGAAEHEANLVTDLVGTSEKIESNDGGETAQKTEAMRSASPSNHKQPDVHPDSERPSFSAVNGVVA